MRRLINFILYPFRSEESAAGSNIIEEPRATAKRYLYFLAGLTALAGIAFFLGLGRLALIGPDEPRYAEVAREMFVTGDYVSPRLCGCLWFEKPALLYWMSAGAYRLFGVNEFAARFPSAISALLTMLFLCHALRRAIAPRLGLMVSLVFVTMGILIGFARADNPDMLLAATMSLSLISGYLFTATEGRARFVYWILCWAGMGAAALAKGLVGIVFIFAILSIFLALAGGLKPVRWREWFAGPMLFLAVSALWYLPVIYRHGWRFIDEFFIEHHLHRYTTEVYGHPQPVYFFLFVALAGAMPWTFFLIPAIARLGALRKKDRVIPFVFLSRPRADRRDRLLLLAWIWLMVPLLFFSFSRSKLPGYLLPVFPAMSIIIGIEVERLFAGERTRASKIAVWMTALLSIGIGIAFAIYLNRKSINPAGWQHALYWGPLTIAVIAALAMLMGRSRAFIAGTAAIVFSVVAGSVVLLFPVLNEELSLRSLSLQAAAALKDGEKITFYVKKEFAPVFYAEGRVVCGVGEGAVLNALQPDKLIPAFESSPSLIVISPSTWMQELENDSRFDTEFIARQGDIHAARVWLRAQASQ